MIRVGIVGAGQNTREKHIPGFQAIEGVQIVSVCNRTLESGDRVAKEFGIGEVFRNWRELVTDKDIDAVVIGTWPYMHAPVTIAALEAGKHVLCEARMAASATEARAMLETARKRPALVAQVVPAPMSFKVDKTIQKLLASGYCGDLLAINVRVGGNFLDEQGPLHWRQNSGYSGVNIMSLGIWYETVMRWVGEAKAVTARGKVFAKTRRDAEGKLRAIRIPEHVDVTAEMACGALMNMQVSAATGFAGGPEIWIFGKEGTILFKDDGLYGGKKGDKSLSQIAIKPEDEGRWRVEEEFINAIRGKEEVKLTRFEDGVRYMEFTESVFRSIEDGKTRCL